MHSNHLYTIKHALKTPVISLGLPAGLSIVGIAALMMPGASPLTITIGWLGIFLCTYFPYMCGKSAANSGSWLLLFISVLLTIGVTANCHYFISPATSQSPSSPVLMNLDAWSAWNNALHSIGRDDCMACPWPAEGYGRFVGLLIGVFGVDIAIPLLFNSFCTLATIALCSSIARQTAGPRCATPAMFICACMMYFLVSGTILIKDSTVAFVTALTAWAALNMRTQKVFWPFMAVIAATFISSYCRPNYVIAQIAVIILLSKWKSSGKSLIYPVLITIGLAATFVCMQIFDIAPTLYLNINTTLWQLPGVHEAGTQHDFYYEVFHDYHALGFIMHLLLLPVTTAIQLLIPLPWTWDKYLMFGPTMAFAHFSFFRYAAGGLIIYFVGAQFSRKKRAPWLLLRLVSIGLIIYLFAAFQFGGTVARYGIPLITLLIPAAAYAYVNYRKARSFRVWAIVYIALITLTLCIFHTLTT